VPSDVEFVGQVVLGFSRSHAAAETIRMFLFSDSLAAFQPRPVSVRSSPNKRFSLDTTAERTRRLWKEANIQSWRRSSWSCRGVQGSYLTCDQKLKCFYEVLSFPAIAMGKNAYYLYYHTRSSIRWITVNEIVYRE
jgi:hypothetical protein